MPWGKGNGDGPVHAGSTFDRMAIGAAGTIDRSPVRAVLDGGAPTTRGMDAADEWGGGDRSPRPRRRADRPRPGGGAAWRRGPGRCRPDQVRGGCPRPGGGDGGGRRAARRRDPQE